MVVLRGGMGKKQRQAAADQMAAIPPSEGRVILATGKYIGEEFDEPRLDTLFLTLPVSWRRTIAQYVGRLHRLCGGKREVRVYDYVDLNCRRRICSSRRRVQFHPTPRVRTEPEAHPRRFSTSGLRRCARRADDST